MTPENIGLILMGIAIGIFCAIFTGVEDAQLVKHNCAYYDKHTGNLTWYDTNTTVH